MYPFLGRHYRHIPQKRVYMSFHYKEPRNQKERQKLFTLLNLINIISHYPKQLEKISNRWLQECVTQ